MRASYNVALPFLRRFIGAMLLGLIALPFLPDPAAADCMASCRARYGSCAMGFNERDCATSRSICMNKCIMNMPRQYGAIAYSPSTGKTGYSIDFTKRQGALRRAITECRAAAKSDDCRVEVWFHDRCAALAVGAGDIRGSAHAVRLRHARRLALGYCQELNKTECKIDVEICSTNARR